MIGRSGEAAGPSARDQSAAADTALLCPCPASGLEQEVEELRQQVDSANEEYK